jgi:hypothetical protein
MRIKKHFFFFFIGITIALFKLNAQSPDSRVCNCFSQTVSPDFMLGAKAVYGNVGVMLSRNALVKPNENVPVKFVIPRLPIKQGCGGIYSIYIADESGNKVYETEDSFNEFTYTFTDCSKTYTVQLMAMAKSPAGNDGNCTRRITVSVKPQCNTATCNCDPVPGKTTTTSINFNIEGKLLCQAPTASQRRYVLQYAFVNKTNCNLVIESVTVLDETVASTPVTIAAKARSTSYNTGFTTPLSKIPPTGGSVLVSVRYRLNDRSCRAQVKISYTPCN